MTVRVDRFDAGRLGKLQRTPTGGVRVPATTSRTGIQEYRRPDGTIRREYRPKEEVEAHLATLAGAAVTIGHPKMPVNADSWRDLAVGSVSDRPAKLDRVEGSPDDWAHTDVLLLRADAILRVEQGELSELSEGYSCRLDEIPGTTETGERYDAVQRDIITNHVALLPAGCARAGSHARLRLDNSQELLDEKGDEMAVTMIKIDGVEYEQGSASHISALSVALAKRDEQVSKLTADHASETATLTAERDAAKDRADKAEAKLATYAARERADATKALVERVKPILGAEYVSQGKTPEQIRKDALSKLRPALSLEGRDDAWIATYLDATLDARVTDFTPAAADVTAVQADRADKTETDSIAARADAARQASYKQFA